MTNIINTEIIARLNRYIMCSELQTFFPNEISEDNLLNTYDENYFLFFIRHLTRRGLGDDVTSKLANSFST